MSKNQPVLIVGGGMGGLAAALGLARKGIETIVLEKAAQLGEIGAGFELAPNALHALDHLGVGDAARHVGVFVDKLVLMDAVTADEIYHVPVNTERFRERFGNSWLTMHRGDLHNVLVEAAQACPAIELRVNWDVVGYEQDGESVTAKTASGQTVRGAALIGADGIWSSIRQQMIGDELVLAGHTAYRALIPVDDMPEHLGWLWNTTTLWGGPDCHIITYPLSRTKVFNLVLVSSDPQYAPSSVVAGVPMTNEEVYARFDFVHPRVKEIYHLAKDYKLWAIGDRDPVDRWVDGRVALLGDAAHPMMQYVAQGACQAFEDAICLAHEIDACSGDIERALGAYQARRAARTARVQLLSRAVGDHIYHPGGSHAQVRDAILSKLPIEDFYDRMAWLWAGTGLTSEPA